MLAHKLRLNFFFIFLFLPFTRLKMNFQFPLEEMFEVFMSFQSCDFKHQQLRTIQAL